MLSQTYFYSFDTKTKPGKIIGHGVRFDSQEFEADQFNETEFKLLCDAHPELKAFSLRGFRTAVKQNFKTA